MTLVYPHVLQDLSPKKQLKSLHGYTDNINVIQALMQNNDTTNKEHVLGSHVSGKTLPTLDHCICGQPCTTKEKDKCTVSFHPTPTEHISKVQRPPLDAPSNPTQLTG